LVLSCFSSGVLSVGLGGLNIGFSTVVVTEVVYGISAMLFPPKLLSIKLKGLKRGAASEVFGLLLVLVSKLPIVLKTLPFDSSVIILSFWRYRFTLTTLRY